MGKTLFGSVCSWPVIGAGGAIIQQRAYCGLISLRLLSGLTLGDVAKFFPDALMNAILAVKEVNSVAASSTTPARSLAPALNESFTAPTGNTTPALPNPSALLAAEGVECLTKVFACPLSQGIEAASRCLPFGIAAALNSKPKYLASTTLGDPQWPETTHLTGDLAAAIGELKARPGGELQVHGSGTLIRWLLANDLVDEMTLIIVPVVLGQCARLFPDAGPDIALELVDARADSKGVTTQVYRPAGRPRYAPAATS
jgi:dihydrofolate reductase